jgi:DNA-binding MurR/RpiR family transcriptional regulator
MVPLLFVCIHLADESASIITFLKRLEFLGYPYLKNSIRQFLMAANKVSSRSGITEIFELKRADVFHSSFLTLLSRS